MLVRESALTACSFPASLTLNPLNRPNLPTNHLATRRLRLDWWGNLLLLLLLIAPLQERSSVRGLLGPFLSFLLHHRRIGHRHLLFVFAVSPSVPLLPVLICESFIGRCFRLRQRQPNPLDLETSLKSEECTKTSPAVSSVDQGPTEPNHERPAVLLPCKLPPTDQGAPHKQVFGVSVAVQSTTRSPGSTPPDETLVAVLASDQGKGLERASSACTTPLVSAEESLLLPDSEDEGSLDTQAMPDAGLQADGPPITSGTASRRCPQKRDRSWYPTLSSRLSTSLCVGS
eukprot:m.257532 g.257532  ORF g.257532 m.257532 type:complete len:287 (+) comp54567_c0_seq32:708-1568(+)